MTTELRQDYLSKEWVALSESRSSRPQFFEKPQFAPAKSAEHCPFCPENMHMTPNDSYRSPDGSIRAIPNLYPAVVPECPEGFGYHEVLIDTIRHDQQLHEYTPEKIASVLSALKDRYNYFQMKENVKHVQVFKNNGPDAGASIEHSHWQIVTLPFVPYRQQTIFDSAADYNGCYICTLREQHPSLTVFENEGSFSVVPYAPLYSCTVNIVPIRHAASIGELDEADLAALAENLWVNLRALFAIKPNSNYNICFNCKATPELRDGFHFFIQIIPRLNNFAGFEISTGCYINSVFPEAWVKKLKDVI